MKKILFEIILFLQIILIPGFAPGQSIDEINEQYNKDYEALKPPSGSSSVRTDYVFEQTALSTRQTTRLLELIYEQNREMLSRYDRILSKYDEIINQNNEIIKLLSKEAVNRQTTEVRGQTTED
ncbi:MAG: hypothetical protein JW944_00275 [Deltaproteobacteria bacterium]|nr:hypothetical protein [Deltaproteobacteria bacterium]